MSDAEFLPAVYATSDPRRATALIIDHIDRLLSAGRFAEIDRILSAIDFARLPSAVRRAVLMTAGWAPAGVLTAYPDAYTRTLSLLSAERGPETAARMLRTLAPESAGVAG